MVLALVVLVIYCITHIQLMLPFSKSLMKLWNVLISFVGSQHLLFKVINLLFDSIPDFNLAEILSSVVKNSIILILSSKHFGLVKVKSTDTLLQHYSRINSIIQSMSMSIHLLPSFLTLAYDPTTAQISGSQTFLSFCFTTCCCSQCPFLAF